MSSFFDKFRSVDDDILRIRIARRELLRRATVLGVSAPILAGLLAACEDDSDDDVEEVDDAPADDDEPELTDDDVEEADDEDDEVAVDIGAHLYGRLEGPEVIRDSSQFPDSFSEAPMLTELVEAGELPPVEERLPVPEDLMVIQPVHEIGRYGGDITRPFTGPSDHPAIARFMGVDKILFCDYTGNETDPALAKDWEMSDDGTSMTIHLREGVKWSDGHPFTADDIIFWWEEVQNNPALAPLPTGNMQVEGEYGEITKIDDYTVVYEFSGPYFSFEEILSTNTAMGDGFSRGFLLGAAYVPAHYVQQYHPNYVPEDELTQMAADEGFDTWQSLLNFKIDWTVNADTPVLTPWRTAAGNGANQAPWILERNPYFWAVDTEGNQLPYADRVVNDLAENLEVANLRAAAGEYIIGERHMLLANLPVLLREQENGNYQVRLDQSVNGSDVVFYPNMNYDQVDQEIGELFQSHDFRRALSLGIERTELNAIFWMGLGTPGNWTVSAEDRYYPGDGYHEMWHDFDPDEANQILDDLGLSEKDNEGYRLRSDGNGRLRLDIAAPAAQTIDYEGISETVAQHWANIGIDARVQALERSLMETRRNANELMIAAWNGDAANNVLFGGSGGMVPTARDDYLGPLTGLWFETGGAEGIEPTWDENILEVFRLLRTVPSLPTEADRNELGQELMRMAAENVWSIGTVGWSSAVRGVRCVSNRAGNVPERLSVTRRAWVPGNSHTSTYFLRD
jgi:peptide/nickel transport system substrate-binding protein